MAVDRREGRFLRQFQRNRKDSPMLCRYLRLLMSSWICRYEVTGKKEDKRWICNLAIFRRRL